MEEDNVILTLIYIGQRCFSYHYEKNGKIVSARVGRKCDRGI